MKKISFKLGILFFVLIIGMETILFLSLYVSLVNDRIEEEMNQLLARGNSHRDVLETNYDRPTIEHVVMMESKAETDVVITDQDGDILYFSNNIFQTARKVTKSRTREISHHGIVLQKNWENDSHISTVSPIHINHEVKGYVYMFQNTASLHTMIFKLKHHFLITGIFSLLLTIIAILFLSKVITKPLIRMKEATEKLSKGDFSVRLQVNGSDELSQLGKTIQTLAKDLEYLKKGRKEFLASISHELRTPLTYVKGYADIARRPDIEEKEREKYVSIIYEEAEHIQKLVKDLFQLAQLDENTFHIDKETVNVCSFMSKVYEKMLPAFQIKKIRLIHHCDTDLEINIDLKRFEQVMLNLLDNALKHSEEGTTVLFKVIQEEKHTKIIISDEGIGIPKEDLPYIFDRLYRVDKSRSRTGGGTGLGLAIVKEIIEAHGGTITAESVTGKGTRMIIMLVTS
ncbi:ATP-binding protein [Metabacillus fastidiosus]|uniref:sensor histidine kinase n=1 Tax=Metabacillus fastidiosus TaxID=1458 RepID=UPI003D279846